MTVVRTHPTLAEDRAGDLRQTPRQVDRRAQRDAVERYPGVASGGCTVLEPMTAHTVVEPAVLRRQLSVIRLRG